MLTEPFLNLCCVISIQSHPEFDNKIAKDIQHILNFHGQKIEDIPLPIRNKFHLAKCLSRMKIEGKTEDTIVDSITTTNKFKDLMGFIDSLQKRKLNPNQISDALKHIRNRKKFTKILKDYEHLESFVKNFEENSFEDIEEVIDTYVKLSDTIFKSVSEDRQKESVEKVSFLSLYNDDYTSVLDQIELNYSGRNSVPSGYYELDEIICKGFQPRRLYTFGGCSGDGKSTLLANIARNCLSRKNIRPERNIYLYITLENLVDETLLRLYCSLTNKSSHTVLKKWVNIRSILEKELKTIAQKNNTDICIQHFQATKVTVFDIAQFINELISQYKGKGEIKAVFIDYLDLIKSGSTFDMYRLEVGQVALELKVLAVSLNLPIITVTQLNRGAYGHDEKLNLAQMGESMKKVDHSDFVGFLRALEDEKTLDGYSKLQISILKNRMGPKNKDIMFKTDFSKYKIENLKESEVSLFEDNLDTYRKDKHKEEEVLENLENQITIDTNKGEALI